MDAEKYEDVTGRVLGCAFRVQNSLGCGFLEKVYENAMTVALQPDVFLWIPFW